MIDRIIKILKFIFASFLCFFLMINLWQLYSRIILKEKPLQSLVIPKS